MAKPAVRRPGGSAGGDSLVVDKGGTIKVISLGGGGSIVGSGGSRVAHIANRTALTATSGSVVATSFNAHFLSMVSGQNAIISALRTIGVLATS